MDQPAMNLLFIGPEITRVEDVRSFGAVWSYYLTRELRRMAIGVRFVPSVPPETPNIIDHFRSLDLSNIDHVVALGLRLFDKVPAGCAAVLNERLQKRCGIVAQLYDGSLLDRCPGVLTLTVRDDDARYPKSSPKHAAHAAGNCYIGWAADPILCQPLQRDDELRILVDHPIYGFERSDRTLLILKSLAAFVRSGTWRMRFTAVQVRQILDGKVTDADLFDPHVDLYERQHIPYKDICAEYSQSHVFMPTHQEASGLSVLESATAGALVVACKDFISPDRLATVRHVEYADVIPWRRVVDSIDVPASRALALKSSWAAVAKRVIEHLKTWKRP